MIGDYAVESRADVFDLRDVQQKPRKFPDARLERMDFSKELGIVFENIREVMRDHRAARAGGHDDVLGIAKDFEKMPRDGARFVRIAGIKSRLAAAGLGLRKMNLVTKAIEHLGDGDADLRKNLIDDAGDKQGDGLAHWGEFNMPGEL